ncbi:MAG TPA: biotin carboxylase N-terminal domain-containing protein [Candidatus Caenarcaniphilales bacterium]|nr:biotin carboxylase N-terminal domain-containing protein [Candidatus Caenarcaniphilales bacterium]
MPDAIGPGEAARRLGVSTRTVQRWLREGRLPAVRVGGRVKVIASALPEPSPEASTRLRARPITRLLIANRGEIVVRIARTCRQLGIHSLALVSDDQARAWWTTAADELVPLAGSYLDQRAVLAAAAAARADAIHPGYGFLAENPDFAAAVEEADIRWVGPPPDAMRALGDKAAARRLAVRVGVPVLDGYDGEDQDDDVLIAEGRRIGLPLLIKPSAGGGGKGMHVVRSESEMREALGRARREAGAAFGDARLVLERYLEAPRHVEVQILRDTHGNAVHLGERECSLQRRHQKVIEEGPSPAVTAEIRRELGEAALALAAAADYEGAGTAEFLLGDDGRFFFLELNARLQVEHPVTELLTGRDLVADQLRIAAGEQLGFGQPDVVLRGHAIEARLYAEDPDNGFLPATGEVADVEWPVDGIRIDAGVGRGDLIGTRYDPLLAKLVAHADDRAEALIRLDAALTASSVLGVTTNRAFLRWLLGLPEVARGATHTGLIEQHWRAAESIPPGAWEQAALALSIAASGSDRSSVSRGFRLNQPHLLRVEIDDEQRSVEIPRETAVGVRWRATSADEVVLDFHGRSVRARLAPPPTVEAAVRHAAHEGDGGQLVSAPMPGSVLQVRVSEGEQVEAGRVLVVLEAMKMENAVPAPAAGRVARILVQAGQQVQRGDPLVELA